MSMVTLGRVDAFCTAPSCKREVIVGPDLLCPHCGFQVDPLSLPIVPPGGRGEIVESTARPLARPETRDSRKPESGPAQQIEVPASREAAAWESATDKLIAALEAEEREATAALEAIRERVRKAKRAAAAMRQVRGLVTVERKAPALAAPKRARETTAPTTPTAEAQPAVPPSTSSERPWSRQFPACINCQSQEMRGKGKHAAKGRCYLCYAYHVKHGVERPVKGRP